MTMTITEALAEVKLIDKKVTKHHENERAYLFRQAIVRDPLEKDGGSAAYVASQAQASGDLLLRLITVRRSIQDANAKNMLTVEGISRTVADWLVWRREVLPRLKTRIAAISTALTNLRNDVKKKGGSVSATPAGDEQYDVIVNFNETALLNEALKLAEIEERLDGKLSLFNAVTLVNLD